MDFSSEPPPYLLTSAFTYFRSKLMENPHDTIREYNLNPIIAQYNGMYWYTHISFKIWRGLNSNQKYKIRGEIKVHRMAKNVN